MYSGWYIVIIVLLILLLQEILRLYLQFDLKASSDEVLQAAHWQQVYKQSWKIWEWGLRRCSNISCKQYAQILDNTYLDALDCVHHLGTKSTTKRTSLPLVCRTCALLSSEGVCTQLLILRLHCPATCFKSTGDLHAWAGMHLFLMRCCMLEKDAYQLPLWWLLDKSMMTISHDFFQARKISAMLKLPDRLSFQTIDADNKSWSAWYNCIQMQRWVIMMLLSSYKTEWIFAQPDGPGQLKIVYMAVCLLVIMHQDDDLEKSSL